ncbi:MAG: 4Fe-4S binding protein [Candidatus Hodarchaeota archaeon]
MPLPRWLADYVGRTIFKARVRFKQENCKLCSTCWSNCPGKAIIPPEELKKGNVPRWIKEKCIMCYCCVELCPYEAVDFRINYIKNALTSWGCITFLVGLISIILLLIWIF